MLMGLQYEQPWLKGSGLFIAIVSLELTYQGRILTKASTVFQKNTFEKISPLKCIRKQNLTLMLSRLWST